MEKTKGVKKNHGQPAPGAPVPLPSVLLTVVILTACVFCWMRDPYWLAISVAVSSLGGLAVCLSIVMHLVGKDNAVTRQFCATEGRFNCDKVLERGKLWKDTTLADLGLIYFCSQFLFLWLGAATGEVTLALGVLFFPAAAAVVMTIGLVVWQAFYIRSWCRMCLMITAILWLQLGGLAWAWTGSWQFPTPLLSLLVISVCVAATWLFFKPWLAMMEQNKRVRLMLTKWKRNTDFFRALLKEQRTVTDPEPWENEFVLGDPQAPLQLICVMGPFCPICANEYPHLSRLLRKPGIQVGVKVRFSLKQTASGDRRVLAVGAILAAGMACTDPADRAQLLRDWFRLMDLDSWQQKWPVRADAIDSALVDKHRQWTAANDIRLTPVYFLNGREVPEIYKLGDLSFHLEKPYSETKKLSE